MGSRGNAGGGDRDGPAEAGGAGSSPRDEPFRWLAHQVPDLVYRVRVHPEVELEYVNPAVEEILGYSPRECFEREGFWSLMTLDDVDRLLAVGADGEPYATLVFSMTRADGSAAWTEHRVVPVRDAEGEVVALEGIARDITSLKTMEAELQHRALHDPLTGLPNRALFVQMLERGLARLPRHPQLLALLYLDLDHFKQVNDQFGHQAGDEVLITIGRRLTAALRPSDDVARLGGDEFVALLPDLTEHEEAHHVARRVLETVAAAVPVGDRATTVTISVGIAFAEPDDISADELIRRGDQAMYRAKRTGRGKVCEWTDALGAGRVVDPD